MEVIQSKPLGEALAGKAQVYPPATRVPNVAESNGLRYLPIALRLVGLTFIVGIYMLIIVWPSGWSWHAGHSHYLPDYLQMILGIYVTLGVFLLIASRNPLAHLSLIRFTVWSSVVHAAIMAVQSLVNPEHRGHLFGDVPALLIVAAVLAVLTPRGTAATVTAEGKKQIL
jgi:uncharacterized protein DUF6632